MNYTNYTKELLEPIVAESFSYSEVCRKLGKKPVGAMWELIKNKIKKFKIDDSHFLGKAAHSGKRHTGKAKTKNADEILVSKNDHRIPGKRLTRALLEINREYKCAECGLENEWNKKPITLEVDHIDWNSLNCDRNNLQFLCPNCHSQRKKPDITKNVCKKCKNFIHRKSTWCKKCFGSCYDYPLKIKNRPSKEILNKEVLEFGYVKTGVKYGVTDNTIRKWLKSNKDLVAQQVERLVEA